MRGLTKGIVAACTLASAWVSLGTLAASAGDRLHGAEAYITVPSEYDPADTVTDAVRRGPRGDEVQLPGGAWIPCSFNCFFTLRNATVDFWRRYDAPH